VSASVTRPPVTPAPFALIFAFMMRETFRGRRFTHPRRQQFEIDQFVEINRCVRHSCSLRQCANKTSALSPSEAQKNVIVLLAVRRSLG
jgi:hypothetical protein